MKPAHLTTHCHPSTHPPTHTPAQTPAHRSHSCSRLGSAVPPDQGGRQRRGSRRPGSCQQTPSSCTAARRTCCSAVRGGCGGRGGGGALAFTDFFAARVQRCFLCLSLFQPLDFQPQLQPPPNCTCALYAPRGLSHPAQPSAEQRCLL